MATDGDMMYVSTITVTDRNRTQILAGTPFGREELVSHTFEVLMDQGYIQEYVLGQIVQPVGVSKHRPLAAQVKRETPDAAINPPKRTAAQKRADIAKASVAKKEAKAAKAKTKADKAAAKAVKAEAKAKEEADAQAKIASKQPKTPAKNSPEQVWIHDPAVCAKWDVAQLTNAYLDTCSAYDIEPKELSTKKDLIAQLTADHNA